MNTYTLEAGRATDLLVAEHIMGWRWVTGPHLDVGSVPVPMWLLPPDVGIGDVPSGEWTWYDDTTYPHDPADPRVTLFDVPRYSAEMGTAWAVVEHFAELGIIIRAGPWVHDWCAYLSWAPRYFPEDAQRFVATTAPLAVCRAGLFVWTVLGGNE